MPAPEGETIVEVPPAIIGPSGHSPAGGLCKGISVHFEELYYVD
jgi:hypothetical protein